MHILAENAWWDCSYLCSSLSKNGATTIHCALPPPAPGMRNFPRALQSVKGLSKEENTQTNGRLPHH